MLPSNRPTCPADGRRDEVGPGAVKSTRAIGIFGRPGDDIPRSSVSPRTSMWGWFARHHARSPFSPPGSGTALRSSGFSSLGSSRATSTRRVVSPASSRLLPPNITTARPHVHRDLGLAQNAQLHAVARASAPCRAVRRRIWTQRYRTRWTLAPRSAYAPSIFSSSSSLRGQVASAGFATLRQDAHTLLASDFPLPRTQASYRILGPHPQSQVVPGS